MERILSKAKQKGIVLGMLIHSPGQCSSVGLVACAMAARCHCQITQQSNSSQNIADRHAVIHAWCSLLDGLHVGLGAGINVPL